MIFLLSLIKENQVFLKTVIYRVANKSFIYGMIHGLQGRGQILHIAFHSKINIWSLFQCYNPITYFKIASIIIWIEKISKKHKAGDYVWQRENADKKSYRESTVQCI